MKKLIAPLVCGIVAGFAFGALNTFWARRAVEERVADREKQVAVLSARIDALDEDVRWRQRILTEAVAEVYGVDNREYFAQALEAFAKDRGRWERLLKQNIRFALDFEKERAKYQRGFDKEAAE